jgi:hypothetical protein
VARFSPEGYTQRLPPTTPLYAAIAHIPTFSPGFAVSQAQKPKRPTYLSFSVFFQSPPYVDLISRSLPFSRLRELVYFVRQARSLR